MVVLHTTSWTLRVGAGVLAVVAIALCVQGIASTATTESAPSPNDDGVLSASVGVDGSSPSHNNGANRHSQAGSVTLCHAIAFPPNPPFHPDGILEPHISARTIDHHYRAHQKGYVTKLNAWIASSANSGIAYPADRGGSSVVTELVRSTGVGSPVHNLASQAFNHALYFAALQGPSGRPLTPASPLAEAIDRSFGSYEAFWDIFRAKAVAHFGSGWVWLVHNKTANALAVVESHDAATPIARAGNDIHAVVPLLVCDVWEHAYYLDRQQKRDVYVSEWGSVIDWRFVEARYGGGQVEYAGDGSYPNFLPPSFSR